MIGLIQGTLLEKQLPEVLVDVQGVGYEIQVPLNALAGLGELGSKVKLYTHFVVREDAQQLYGFIDKTCRALFRSLIKVNGVGPKLAMTILSSIEVASFVQAIQQHDSQALVRIPGIGKKTAERLVIEMCDRLKEWQNPASAEFQLMAGIDRSAKSQDSPNQGADPSALDKSAVEYAKQEAEAALISLGYKPAQAHKALTQVRPDARSTEDFIRLALRQFALNP
jgi:Holliday junction DNA helicase RuvA